MVHVFPENHQITKKDCSEILYKPKWGVYRFSDGCRAPYIHGIVDDIKKRFPDTFTGKWLKELERNKWKQIDSVEKWEHFYEFLKPLVHDKEKQFREETGIDITKECVFHLRVGDLFKAHLKERRMEHLHRYHTPTGTLYSLVKTAKEMGFKKIYIFCGIHALTYQWEKNVNYMKDVRNIFLKYGMKFQIITGDPDMDFSVMCKAKVFCVSGGGYSANVQRYRSHFLGKELDLPFFNQVYNHELHKGYYRHY
jgi:hypothetical protein